MISSELAQAIAVIIKSDQEITDTVTAKIGKPFADVYKEYSEARFGSAELPYAHTDSLTMRQDGRDVLYDLYIGVTVDREYDANDDPLTTMVDGIKTEKRFQEIDEILIKILEKVRKELSAGLAINGKVETGLTVEDGQTTRGTAGDEEGTEDLFALMYLIIRQKNCKIGA